MYATNFGLPYHPPCVIGLPLAYITSIFIRLGIPSYDAYSLAFDLWLVLGFYGAFKISRIYNVPYKSSILLATLWMSTPILWGHSMYFSLSLAFSLLPFYIFTSLFLFMRDRKWSSAFIAITFNLLATIISIFMDGYSFMMFAASSGILFLYILLRVSNDRKIFSISNFFLLLFNFAFAYVLYIVYIGKTSYDYGNISVFRTYGIDLMYLIIPTKGSFWLWDTLRASIDREMTSQWGDSPIWGSTFAILMIITGISSWFRTRKKNIMATGFLIIALFGFYMSLGPSLKINNLPDRKLATNNESGILIPNDIKLIPTGSGIISKNLPGFNMMRASYRWELMMFFGFWILIVLFVSIDIDRKKQWSTNIIILFLIVSNFPNLKNNVKDYISFESQYKKINKTIVADIKRDINKSDIVAFLPWGNDYLANYISSVANIKTYNVGGDKNIELSSQYWPYVFKNMGNINFRLYKNFADYISVFLLSKNNVAIFPYFDMRFNSYSWPPKNLRYKKEVDSIVEELKKSGNFEISVRKYYVIVRAQHNYYKKMKMFTVLKDSEKIEFNLSSIYSMLFLKDGWYTAEKDFIWSGKNATLEFYLSNNIPVNIQHEVILSFYMSELHNKQPREVIFTINNVHRFVFYIPPDKVESVRIPLPKSIFSSKDKQLKIDICIPSATSPRRLNITDDNRILGLALMSIKLN